MTHWWVRAEVVIICYNSSRNPLSQWVNDNPGLLVVHLWRLPTGCAIPVTQTITWIWWNSALRAQWLKFFFNCPDALHTFVRFRKKWGLSPVLIHCFKMMFHYKWIVSILVSILKQGYPQLSNGKRYPARFPSLRDWPWIFCAWGIGYGSKPWYPTPKIVDEWIWVYYNDSLTWNKASDIGYNI